jgi:hypothetical protein
MEMIKPETVVEMLRQEGLQVTLEEAAQIIFLVYTLAEIAVIQILQNENS